MQIRALMIDVDGVLVSGRPCDGLPWASTIEADLGVGQADLHQGFFARYWDDIVIGHRNLAQDLKPVLETLAPHLSYEDFIRYWFENDAWLNELLLEELGQLRERGTKVYLATNQEHLRASYLTEQLGLGQHCDGIYYSAALGCRKPDPFFFTKVAALSGFAPEQLLLIDDTAANVAAARALGWNAIEWKEGSSLSVELAKLEFSQAT